MKHSRVFFLLGLMAASSAHSVEAEQPHNGYLIKLRPGASITGLVSSSAGLTESSPNHFSTSFGDFVQVDSLPKTPKGLKSWNAHPAIEYIEPNYIVTVNPLEASEDSIPYRAAGGNTPKISKQWGLENRGPFRSCLFFCKAGEDINARKAWKVTKGERKIKIAVIDTGVEYGHKDLRENIWVNEAEKNGKAGVDDDGNGYVDDVYGYDFANNDPNPMDGHGHGTHCAGVIGARHNGFGIAGVMDNLQIVSIKFLKDNGSGDLAAAVRSIDYAIKVGVDIMSNSWGGGGFSQSLKDAIERANEAGIAFVAAAGNSSMDNDRYKHYPSNYKVDNVISVGAMNASGKRAGFSNYGQMTVHVFAPGKDILSTFKGNSYKKLSGTSMATPFVSGILGLMMSKEGADSMSLRQMREQLIDSSVQSSGLEYKSVSKGRVDAYRFLTNQVN